MEADLVVIALGTNPNPLVPRTTYGLDVDGHGRIVADPQTGATSCEGVYAGGDIVTGAATVILAMGAGRRAATAMHEYLQRRGDLEAEEYLNRWGEGSAYASTPEIGAELAR
jgi:glutamate synthase (NADPH/NADH) small chain